MSTTSTRQARPAARAFRGHRLITTAGELAFGRGTLWFFPAHLALLRMQELHRRSVGARGPLQLAVAGRLSARGLAKVRGEWSLITLTHNVLKLWRALGGTLAGRCPAGGARA